MSPYVCSVEFTHDEKAYVVDVDCDPSLSKPRLVHIYDEDGNRVYPTITVGQTRRGNDIDAENPEWKGLHAAAWNAIDNEAERVGMRQQARLLADPPESYESMQAKVRLLK